MSRSKSLFTSVLPSLISCISLETSLPDLLHSLGCAGPAYPRTETVSEYIGKVA